MKRFRLFASVFTSLLLFTACNTATITDNKDVTESETLSTQSPQSTSLEVLVPYYRDLDVDAAEGFNFWENIEQSASVVPITAVINPSNNNSAFTDPLCTYGNYNDTSTETFFTQVVDMDTLETAGVNTIGYVPTNYTSVSLADAKNNIKRFIGCNNLDGIFFDEVQLNTKDDLQYYTKLCKYAKKKFGKKGTYVLNTGVVPTLSSKKLPNNKNDFCDTLVVFENYTAEWGDNFHLASYQNYQNNKPNYLNNSALIHSDDDLDNISMEDAIDTACQRNIDYVYVTDDTLANPWDTLGSDGYWDNLIDYVANGSSCN